MIYPMHFGEHVTIDGYEGDPVKLDSEQIVRECFGELLAMLNMHALTEPLIVSAPDNHIKDPGGWSGFVIIAESHISIHTFPKRKFVSADVYTCQNGLDVAAVVEFFKTKFGLKEVEQNFIKRGMKYPEHNLL